MKKKIIGIVVCILLIGTVLSVSGSVDVERTTIRLSSGNTLYVGGIGPDNYTSIQEAIGDTSDGDTVFVYDDSSPYFENLVVDKSISLIGENKHTTIIDGDRTEDADVIHIVGDGVTVKGFTIQGSNLGGSWPEHDCGIEIRSHNNIIKDNIIRDNNIGIVIGEELGNESNGNIIQENVVTENDEFGVYVIWSRNNLIEGNLIYSNKYHGIFLYSDSSNNILTRNNISSHGQLGIWLLGSDNNTVQYNSVVNNRDGIIISSATQNKVIENNIFNTKIDAMMDGDTLGLILYKWRSNTWDGNYWGQSQLLPKLILSPCALILPNFIWLQFLEMPLFIPLISFDWHPAQEPYDI